MKPKLLRSGEFYFRMSDFACYRLAQMLYESGTSIGELEDLFGRKLE
jgi:hypothetical protein